MVTSESLETFAIFSDSELSNSSLIDQNDPSLVQLMETEEVFPGKWMTLVE